MNNYADRYVNEIRLAFWRVAAAATKEALAHQNTLRKAFPVLPLIAFAFAAFLVGRWAGLLLIPYF